MCRPLEAQSEWRSQSPHLPLPWCCFLSPSMTVTLIRNPLVPQLGYLHLVKEMEEWAPECLLVLLHNKPASVILIERISWHCWCRCNHAICILNKTTHLHFWNLFQRIAVCCLMLHWPTLLSASFCAPSSPITDAFQWRLIKSNFSTGQNSVCCKFTGGIQTPHNLWEKDQIFNSEG